MLNSISIDTKKRLNAMVREVLMLSDYNVTCPVCGERSHLYQPVNRGEVDEQNRPLKSLPVECDKHGMKYVSYQAGLVPDEPEIQTELNRQFSE